MTIKVTATTYVNRGSVINNKCASVPRKETLYLHQILTAEDVVRLVLLLFQCLLTVPNPHHRLRKSFFATKSLYVFLPSSFGIFGARVTESDLILIKH